MTLNEETVAAVVEQQQSINAKRAQIKQLEKDIELLSNNITTYLWKEIADLQPFIKTKCQFVIIQSHVALFMSGMLSLLENVTVSA